MKIAIVGTGIAGLTAAWHLHEKHDITVFEAADRVGGHTATVDVEVNDREYRVDTGFIVFNDWTYPEFIRMMDELGVVSRPSDMSFAVSCEDSSLEYAGKDGRLDLYNGLFAQRRRLFSPAFLRMLVDILRFNRQAIRDVETEAVAPETTLREYVKRHHLGDMFRDYYLVPMTSAIWSTPFRDMYDFPMDFMLPFLYRHGLLSVNERPRWRTIEGGSDAYIAPLTAGFRDRIRLSTPVLGVSRHDGYVHLRTEAGLERFDQVILACHSDQALTMLEDASELERRLLSAIRYQENDVILHTDPAVLPRNLRARASWNYRMDRERDGLPKVTYDMNRLMGLPGPEQFCVTLNDRDAIRPECILREFRYAHPVFSREGAAAQQRWEDINGVQRTWFCGAWWGKGFHEDGVKSALQVVEALAQVRL